MEDHFDPIITRQLRLQRYSALRTLSDVFAYIAAVLCIGSAVLWAGHTLDFSAVRLLIQVLFGAGMGVVSLGLAFGIAARKLRSQIVTEDAPRAVSVATTEDIEPGQLVTLESHEEASFATGWKPVKVQAKPRARLRRNTDIQGQPDK